MRSVVVSAMLARTAAAMARTLRSTAVVEARRKPGTAIEPQRPSHSFRHDLYRAPAGSNPRRGFVVLAADAAATPSGKGEVDPDPESIIVMKFTHYDLKQQKRGTRVRVTLKGNAANVRLMDGSNLSAFKARRSHRYAGGHYNRSPVDLVIPRDGHWHVVVDLGGASGSVRSSIELLPGALPPGRRMNPGLATIADNIASYDDADDDKEFDVFISHASEDKDDVVRALAHALDDDHGLRVWYDEFELRIGDSLRRKIDTGIARTRFGVVVLSHAFFAKGWSGYELDGLVVRELSGGKQIILPLWHNISKDEIIAKSPSLADKVALQTATSTIHEIAEQIAAVVAEAEQPVA
jgi:hypothetical protein